jgi:hypothetical protein
MGLIAIGRGDRFVELLAITFVLASRVFFYDFRFQEITEICKG